MYTVHPRIPMEWQSNHFDYHPNEEKKHRNMYTEIEHGLVVSYTKPPNHKNKKKKFPIYSFLSIQSTYFMRNTVQPSIKLNN